MRLPDLVNVAQPVLCVSTLLTTLPHPAVSADEKHEPDTKFESGSNVFDSVSGLMGEA